MKCLECSSDNIIWDYHRGEIVCAECGLVQDRIYVTHTRIKEELNANNNLTIKTQILEVKSRVKNYEVEISRYKLKPYLKFSEEFLEKIASGAKVRRVKTIVRRDNAGRLPERYKVVLEVFSKYPRVTSRTDRMKEALAELLSEYVKKGSLEIGRIARKYNVHPTNLRKAYKAAIQYENLINELKIIVR